MDVVPDKDQLGIQAWKEADADAADHSEVTPVGSAGQPEIWSDRQLRPALEILAGRHVEALSTWRADAIGTVPTITGIVFAPSGTASQFTSGLSRSRVESGVTSTPACSRGVNLHQRRVHAGAAGGAWNRSCAEREPVLADGLRAAHVAAFP